LALNMRTMTCGTGKTAQSSCCHYSSGVRWALPEVEQCCSQTSGGFLGSYCSPVSNSNDCTHP
jgi:hypothetical protein